MNINPYVVLIRPANIITAISDILAGSAIAGYFVALYTPSILKLILLLLSSSCLYAGGIVFNDIFDVNIDRSERPERPLPKDQISVKNAQIFGITLFILGILFSFLVQFESGIIAFLISVMALIYDRFTKDYLLVGSLNMGLCRGLNLVLGMSILPQGLYSNLIWICIIPIIFIAAITLTSKGEVRGNNRPAIFMALILDITVTSILLGIAIPGCLDIWMAGPFILFWIGMNVKAKIKAISKNSPEFIKMAVKIGVLSLIPLNASFVAGFGHWILGLCTLLLLPVSIALAKKFSVT